MKSRRNYPEWLSERARFLYENLNLAEASGVPTARWERFQLLHLSDRSMLRIEDKSRQIAWSFLSAIEGVANALLYGTDSVFVSINLEEAKEKIRYARYAYHAIENIRLPNLVGDASYNIEFANGARLTSLPARAPRGRARTNVYLDEFAHSPDAEEIYTATLPIISKGGRLRIASSPFGAAGKFWEIFTESMQPYPDFRRKVTPWWEIYAFCNNVPQAIQQAPAMPTADVVEVFGNERLQIIFANMVLEDFEQEYCCLFNDTTTAWFTYDEIKDVQDKSLAHERAVCRGVDFSDALLAIIRLRQLIEDGDVEPTFVMGVDIGRTHDATDIILLGIAHNVESYPLRLTLTLQGMPFDEQYEVLSSCLSHLPVARALIDRTGLGWQLAETAVRAYRHKAYGVDFNTASKVMWATDAKKFMQQGKTPLPVDKDLAYQLHSIKRINTGTYLRFDAERTDRGHADKAWAWMLALAAAKQLKGQKTTSQVRSRASAGFVG